jgi:hypothetical protein
VEVHCGGVSQVVSGGALWRCESGGLSVEVHCGGVSQVSGGALWRLRVRSVEVHCGGCGSGQWRCTVEV